MKEPGGPEAGGTRLGIAHLLVWTACTALYLGLTRSLHLVPAVPGSGAAIALWSLQGIGAGAALGGLLLLMARMFRGVPFAVHPGEMLLGVTAVSVVLATVTCAVLLTAIVYVEGEPPAGLWFVGFSLAQLACVSLYLGAALRVHVPRWRFYFLLTAGAIGLRGVGLLGETHSGILLWLLPELALPVLLSVIAAADLIHRCHYPWTHWLGIATALWLGVLQAINMAWMAMAG
jgi:hypothetical protein